MDPDTPPVRLKDIAARAGVSLMTVSLSLKNDTRISKARRSQVQKLAAEMGYVANPMLAALSDYRKSIRPVRFLETIAMVVAHDEDTSARPWLDFRADAASARLHAAELGYAFELIHAGETRQSQTQTGRILRNRGIRGVIVNPVYCNPTKIAMSWDSLVAVFTSVFPEQTPLVSVGSDNFIAAMRVVRKLAAKGYERPALFITAKPEERGVVQWVGGYEAGVFGSKNQTHLQPLILADYDPKVFKSWIAKQKPDVVIGTTGDWIAQELGKLGYRVPKDIGYCGLDVGVKFPHVSGIRQNRPEICCVAVDLLSSMLRRNAVGAPRTNYAVTVDAAWKDGKTLRK